jgi:hypothetical protein
MTTTASRAVSKIGRNSFLPLYSVVGLRPRDLTDALPTLERRLIIFSEPQGNAS